MGKVISVKSFIFFIFLAVIVTNFIFLFNTNATAVHSKMTYLLKSHPLLQTHILPLSQSLKANLADMTKMLPEKAEAQESKTQFLNRLQDKAGKVEQSCLEAILASKQIATNMTIRSICQTLIEKGNRKNSFDQVHVKQVLTEAASSERSILPSNETEEQLSTPLVSCVDKNQSLVGLIKPLLEERSPENLTAMFPQLEKGGHYTPEGCVPKEKTAIIIVYRSRYSHLHILILNIVPLLIRQNIDFTFFLIEQLLPGPFNRGMLFNVGFLEALKLDNYQCFIFHDVDLIPINDSNYYHCNDVPTHFASGVDKFNYRLLYKQMFGGVVAFTREQFQKVNGASNLYFGWGGEDDDLLIRVTSRNYRYIRTDRTIGQYNMIKHKRDTKNEANPARRRLLKTASKRLEEDGLNTALYKTVSVELLPLYIWVKVHINMSEVLNTAPHYMKQEKKLMINTFNSLGNETTKTLESEDPLIKQKIVSEIVRQIPYNSAKKTNSSLLRNEGKEDREIFMKQADTRARK